MKEKSKSIIQAVIGAVIMIIGIVLCVNTYVVKGNKAYAFSLLVQHYVMLVQHLLRLIFR